MFRFISFIWNSQAADQCRFVNSLCLKLQDSRERWNPIYHADGINVWTTGHPPVGRGDYSLPGGIGTIVGSLLSSSIETEPRYSQVEEIDPLHATEILRTRGRALIERYWGWYVALINDAPSKKLYILRSPMSELPCFYTMHCGVYVVFSHTDDIAQLHSIPVAIDWQFVARQIAYGFLGRISECGLSGIHTVIPGQCLELSSGNTKIHTYWNPRDLTRRQFPGTFEQAVLRLRSTVVGAIGAWISNQPSVALRLSGGIDSSIVLACLREFLKAEQISCLTFFSPGPRNDERIFAHKMASFAGVQLFEKELDSSCDLGVMSRVRRTPAPILNMLDFHIYEWEQKWAKDRGATGIYGGSVGDALFEKNTHLSPAADYLALRGLREGFIKTVIDVARYQRVSIWKVLRHTFRLGVLNKPTGAWSIYPTLRSEGIFRSEYSLLDDSVAITPEDQWTHPWLADVTGVPPGKLWQLSSIWLESFADSHFIQPDDIPIMPVLLSQPVVELCLQIPTFYNVLDGWDRAVARNAFASHLPNEIFRRSTKGTPDHWLRNVIEHNSEFVREFLLDGLLQQAGLLSKRKLEQALPGTTTRHSAPPSVIMNLVCTEAWLRSWERAKGISSASAWRFTDQAPQPIPQLQS